MEPARGEQGDPAGAVGLLRLPVAAMEPAGDRRDNMGTWARVAPPGCRNGARSR
jgi:hypothetical protein